MLLVFKVALTCAGVYTNMYMCAFTWNKHTFSYFNLLLAEWEMVVSNGNYVKEQRTGRVFKITKSCILTVFEEVIHYKYFVETTQYRSVWICLWVDQKLVLSNECYKIKWKKKKHRTICNHVCCVCVTFVSVLVVNHIGSCLLWFQRTKPVAIQWTQRILFGHSFAKHLLINKYE